MENRKAKQVLSGGWHQWERGGYKERVKEGEYGGILCTHI
jgi:chitinase